MNKVLLFLLGFLFCVSSAFCADCYTDSSTGNDTTGDGSTGTPYATVQKCLDTSSYGDTIHLSNVADFSISTMLSLSTVGGTKGVGNWLNIVSWDNGGSKTITLADGSTIPRADIVGDGVIQHIVNYSTPTSDWYINFYGIRFSGATDGIRARPYTNFRNCEITGLGSGAQQFGIWLTDYCTAVGCRAFSGGSATTNYAFYTFGNGPSLVMNSQVTDFDYGYWASNNETQFVGNSAYDVEYGVWTNSDDTLIINNTLVGGTGGSGSGIGLGSVAQGVIASHNVVDDFAEGIEITTNGEFAFIGPNQLTRNTAHYGDTYSGGSPVSGYDNTAGDITSASDPFTNSSIDDYTLASGNAGVGAGDGPANGTTLNFNMGAYQGAAASGTQIFVIGD